VAAVAISGGTADADVIDSDTFDDGAPLRGASWKGGFGRVEKRVQNGAVEEVDGQLKLNTGVGDSHQHVEQVDFSGESVAGGIDWALYAPGEAATFTWKISSWTKDDDTCTSLIVTDRTSIGKLGRTCLQEEVYNFMIALDTLSQSERLTDDLTPGNGTGNAMLFVSVDRSKWKKVGEFTIDNYDGGPLEASLTLTKTTTGADYAVNLSAETTVIDGSLTGSCLGFTPDDNLRSAVFAKGLGAGNKLCLDSFEISHSPAGEMTKVEPKGDQPNVLVVFVDDLGYGDPQCYNPESKIPTPHIDQLAADGMMFTDGHSASAVCTPSRYSILTGRYPWRSRLQQAIMGIWGYPLIPTDRLTIGSLAKQQGYRTACMGKWHLGWRWGEKAARFRNFPRLPEDRSKPTYARQQAWKDVFSQPIKGGPIDLGFDIYFGSDVPNWPPFAFMEQDRIVGMPSEFLPDHMVGKSLTAGGAAVENWSLEAVLPALGNRAAEFITESAKEEAPFLLHLTLTTPHTPVSPGEKWQGKSGINAYADLVMETDDILGQVLAALEKTGEAEDTLVVFTSDNGIAYEASGGDGLVAKGHNPSGPLRGSKSDIWEGGHRVPFIIRWPKVVTAGSQCDQLVNQTDLMRTFADIWSVELPADAGEDSVSMLPLLKGEEKPIREHTINVSIKGVPALRVGAWKYMPGSGSGGWSEGGDPTQSVQLYNLDEDLGETTNLADRYPGRVEQMQELLEELIIKGRSTPGPDQPNDVEVIRHPPTAVKE